LFALLPALHAARTPEPAPLLEVLAAVATLALGAALAYRLVRLVVKDRFRAGLLLSCAIVVCVFYAMIHAALERANDWLDVELFIAPYTTFRHRYLLPLLGLLLATAVGLLLRTRRDLRPATRLANLAAAVLVAVALGRIALARGPATVAAEADHPDIYYVILDRYPDAGTLRAAYGYDNRDFLDYLRGKGFYVAEQSRCNYPETTISLASSLNLRYHPREIYHARILRGLRRRHLVGDFLRARGYRFVHLGSHHDATLWCDTADENLDTLLPPSLYLRRVVNETPLVVKYGTFDNLTFEDHARIAHAQLERLETLASSPERKFVLAHLLLPHPPFVFDREGRPLARPSQGFGEGAKAMFLEQLRFTNTQMRRFVDTVLARAPRPPIIILQAEEGPFLRETDHAQPVARRHRIRAGILNAYFFPGGTYDDLYPTLTPVNSFRIVLTRFFGASFEPLADRVYGWEGQDWVRNYPPRRHVFHDVTDLVRD
jgi:hypothetical protein